MPETAERLVREDLNDVTHKRRNSIMYVLIYRWFSSFLDEPGNAHCSGSAVSIIGLLSTSVPESVVPE